MASTIFLTKMFMVPKSFPRG